MKRLQADKFLIEPNGDQQRLALYQRRMSRKVTFSSNGKKGKPKVQKTHTCIANGRKDLLLKTTTGGCAERSAKTTRSSVLRICGS